MKMKTLIAMLLLIALILCGCGEGVTDPTNGTNPPASANYVIKFCDDEGNPVAGVVTRYVRKDGNENLILSEADGTITVQADLFEAKCTILTPPSGYTADKNEYELSAETTILVMLHKQEQNDDNPTYVIKVIDQYEKPVAGALVQVCDDHNCQLPLTTDEFGNVSACYAPSNYHVTLNSLPEGYTSEQTVFYFEENTDGPYTVTIVVQAGE